MQTASQPDPTQVNVRTIADLARVALTDAEAEQFQNQLHDILEYVGQLDELDLDGIEPTAHATAMANVLRDDIPRPTMDRKHFVANAPAAVDDAYVRVPPVIEEDY